MVRALALALLIPLFASMPQPAAADATYTPARLSALLVTQDQLSLALLSHGSALVLAGAMDLPSGTDPVGVGRKFAGADGSFLTLMLYSLADGSQPDGAVRDGLLSGEFTRVASTASFTPVKDFTVAPSRWGDGLDMLATFLGTAGGIEYNVMGCSFIRGNVFGLILYATTDVNDGTVVASAFEAQLNKLP